MFKFSRNKIALFGFLAVMLVGIPLSLYVIQQNTDQRQRAEKATKMTFLPTSSSASPILARVGDTVALDINVDPGTNIVSFIKLEVEYDDTKLATAAADALQVNDAAFPVTLEGPTFTPGKVSITLSVGSDPTKAVQTITKAATITFQAVADTGGATTDVVYGNATEILSIGSNDQASENVLLSVDPAVIQIDPADVPVTPTDTVTPTVPPTTPPSQPTATTAPTAVPTGPTASANQVPVCQSLNVDRETTGAPPYAVTFTAVGTDADGTISKVTFNYGDGPVEVVTEAGGIGTNSISSQKSHTYNNPGTYSASVILTDNVEGVSDSNTCTQTIIVLAPTTSSGTGGGGGGGEPQPTTPIENPGPGDVFLGLGALAAVLTLLGGLIFFAM